MQIYHLRQWQANEAIMNLHRNIHLSPVRKNPLDIFGRSSWGSAIHSFGWSHSPSTMFCCLAYPLVFSSSSTLWPASGDSEDNEVALQLPLSAASKLVTSEVWA